MSIKDYFELTKPRMVLGNALAAVAGFFAGYSGSLATFWPMLVGVALVMGAACACNNVYDRHIDSRMERTKGRAVAAGRVSVNSAILFASLLFTLGIYILYALTNTFALGTALVGFVSYVFVYTPLKHRSGHALWVGAVAGATPPVVGYAAATGTLDHIALLLFIALFVWQVPHFLAIALYRFDEYQAAGVPLLVNKPSEHTRHIARKVFHCSLVVLLMACVALIARPFLPPLL